MSNGTPPPIGTDIPGSAPGIPQPIIASAIPGVTELPPSFPEDPPGSGNVTWGWLPPPLVTEGGNTPFPRPVVPPGIGPTPPYISFGTGSETVLPVEYWFPRFSEPGPVAPIVLTQIFNQGENPPPYTPGTNPVKISTAPNIPQLPWVPFPPPAPVCTVNPLITIITPPATVGGQLACSNGTWSGGPTFTRQWFRGSTAIAGATALAYTMVAADEGQMLHCVVTATNPGGSASAQAAPVGPVNPPAEEEPARRRRR